MDTRALRTPVCLLISLAIVGWLGHCITQTNSHLHEIAAGAGADGSLSLTAQQLQDDEERSPARKGRSLLQNPDKPSLNKYGGLTMESECPSWLGCFPATAAAVARLVTASQQRPDWGDRGAVDG
jgi:hypothetical protein